MKKLSVSLILGCVIGFGIITLGQNQDIRRGGGSSGGLAGTLIVSGTNASGMVLTAADNKVTNGVWTSSSSGSSNITDSGFSAVARNFTVSTNAILNGATKFNNGSSGITPNSNFTNLWLDVNSNGGISIATPDANLGALQFSSPSAAQAGILYWFGSTKTLTLGDMSGGIIQIEAGGASSPGGFTFTPTQLLQGETAEAHSSGGIFYAGRTNTFVSNAHAFVDESEFRAGAAGVAYNSFDDFAIFSGTSAMDHVVGFQSRPVFRNSGGVTNLASFASLPTIQGSTNGHVQTLTHFRVWQDTSAGGLLDTQLGLYVPSLTGGTTNWAILTEGDTVSKLSGGIATLSTNAAVVIASTGWTNTLGKNAVVYVDGTATTYTIYNNAGTAVRTNSVAAGQSSTAILQISGKIIGTGLSGNAVPF